MQDTTETERSSALGSAFRAAFARDASAIVHAPGRVNLIGEHTDYNGLPVFPMAIQRSVRLAVAPRSDRVVKLANVDARFGAREFELAPTIEPFAPGDWGNYAKAAAQMLVARGGVSRGFDALVDGDIPSAAGLSSSSALVVACALALMAVNELEVERLELATLCARAERYVGTQSGGMDQAISLGGRAGHALVIDFEPLAWEPVRVPDDWRFVIANTFVRAEKSGAAKEAYNARTRECREALQTLRTSRATAALPSTYRELVERVPTGELLDAGRKVLDRVLLRRFKHVVTEGARVRSAREVMLRGDLAGFGALMNASHQSLRDDYEVSCAELDELVHLAREAGAAGARLTGAGMGGCIVALTSAARADELVSALRSRYHAPRGLDGEAGVLVAHASEGASVTRA